MVSEWNEHLRKYREEHPGQSLKEAMKGASASYTKKTPSRAPSKPRAKKEVSGAGSDGWMLFWSALQTKLGRIITPKDKTAAKKILKRKWEALHGNGTLTGTGFLETFLGIKELPKKGEPGNSGNFIKDFGWGFAKGFHGSARMIKKGAGLVTEIASLLAPEVAPVSSAVGATAGILEKVSE